jgi:hypothetical protein
LDEGFDVRFARQLSKRDANRAAALPGWAAEGREDVARGGGTGGARAPRGDGDAREIEMHQEFARIDAFECDARDVWKT